MTGTQVESLQDLPPLDGNDDPSSVSVHGRFVRKRNLSKGLVFGDIQLKDGELLEVMIRAQEGILDFAAIRQINWDVHLGDLVTACGILQRKRHEPGHPDGWLFVLHSIQIDELWSLHHDGAVFSYTDSTNPDSTGDASSPAAVKGSWVLPPSSKAGATNKYTNMVVLDGFNACKYYFSSSGGTNCLRGEQCHFWHGQPEDFKENRRRWMAKRLEQRAKAAHLAGDSGDPHSKIDKAQRSRIFCDWLVESLGEGRLAAGTESSMLLVAKRPMKLGKYNRKLVAKAESTKGRKMSPQLLRCLDDEALKLYSELFTDCSVFVGMHPDEATEAIVDAALKLGKPFAIVPCCVMSRVFPDRQCQDGTPVDTTTRSYGICRNQVLYLFDYGEERDASADSVKA
ncbi:Nucleic acid-binding, OB-fold [Phytophthora cactorum]|nr:Nucleic acid-binding, OB-fold [Phytophthora cactorum]